MFLEPSLLCGNISAVGCDGILELLPFGMRPHWTTGTSRCHLVDASDLISVSRDLYLWTKASTGFRALDVLVPAPLCSLPLRRRKGRGGQMGPLLYDMNAKRLFVTFVHLANCGG